MNMSKAWNNSQMINNNDAFVSTVYQLIEQKHSYNNIRYISPAGHGAILFLIGNKVFSVSGDSASGSTYGNGGIGVSAQYRQGNYSFNNPNLVPLPEKPIKKIGGDGNRLSFCLFKDGDLYTWGGNISGQAGLGHLIEVEFPVLAAQGVINAFHHPSSSGFNLNTGSCFFILKQDGLYATGINTEGNLGVGDTINRNVFTKCIGFPAGVDYTYFKKVYPIGTHNVATFVLTSDGILWHAGQTDMGESGVVSSTNNTSFTDVTANWVPAGKTLEDIVVYGARDYQDSLSHGASSIGIWLKYTDGTSEIKTAGSQDWGAVGNGVTSVGAVGATSPLNIPTDGSIVDFAGIGVGGPFTYKVLLSNGDLISWGYNKNGQAGDGTTNNISTPKVVETGVEKLLDNGLISHSWGYLVQSFILKADGTYACGYNDAGTCYTGSGNLMSDLVYTKVRFPDNDNRVKIKGAYAIKEHAFIHVALTENNNLYAWGYNYKSGIVITHTTTSIKIPKLLDVPMFKEA